MSRRLLIVLGVLAMVGAGVLVIGLRGAAEATAPVTSSTGLNPIPTFDPFPAPTVQGKTLDGSPIDLADYRGKPVVLNFWASWCVPCRREIPAIAAFAKDHPELQVIGVNYQDNMDDANAFVQEFGVTWPSIIDDGSIGKQFAVPGLPATFLIDADGQVVDRALGEVTKQLLDERVKALSPPP